jgi:glutaredoxin
MKYLIFKKDLFYTSDEESDSNGQTRSVSGYNAKTISNTNMPHQYFNKKIVIYGRNTCPYCIGILDYFKKYPTLNKKVLFIDIEAEPSSYFSKSNLLNILKSNEKTFKKNHTTVPIVFYKGEFIGGSDDSKKYFDSDM